MKHAAPGSARSMLSRREAGRRRRAGRAGRPVAGQPVAAQPPLAGELATTQQAGRPWAATQQVPGSQVVGPLVATQPAVTQQVTEPQAAATPQAPGQATAARAATAQPAAGRADAAGAGAAGAGAGGGGARLAELPYLLVLACTAGSLAVIELGAQYVRSGTLVLAGVLLIAATARLALPSRRVGMLSSRRKLVDVAIFVALGGGLLIAGLVIQAAT